MTGHVYKKKRPPDNATEEERVIMHEGDASSSSVTSESDRGSDKTRPRFLPYGTTVRRKLDEYLHSLKCQILIVCLVIFNCLVVIVGLLIDLRIFELDHTANSITAARILYYINLSLLSLFLIEMALKIVAWGLKFVKHRMEVFDLVVVLLAFGLGLVLSGRENSADGIGLLIMLRLWRVTKILNSMVASVKQEAERKMGKERRARRALEREVAKLREYCLQQECELQMYRMMLQQNNIPQPTVLRPPAAPRTLNVIVEVNETESGVSSDDSDIMAPPPEYSETMALQHSANGCTAAAANSVLI